MCIRDSFEYDHPQSTEETQTHAHTDTTAGKRPSLYYDVSSIINPLAHQHYEMMDSEAHYETAGNFNQCELLALPYEIPTPSVSSCKMKMQNFR